MLRPETQAEIESRVKAINCTPAWLARSAGVAKTTVQRGAKTRRKHNAMVVALEAEELRLLRHLVALHPQEALEAATVALCPERRMPQKEATE